MDYKHFLDTSAQIFFSAFIKFYPFLSHFILRESNCDSSFYDEISFTSNFCLTKVSFQIYALLRLIKYRLTLSEFFPLVGLMRVIDSSLSLNSFFF